MQAELIPRGPAGRELVVPRHVVEPEEKVLRTSSKVVELRGEGLVVLVDIVSALTRAVEADAVGAGIVVEGRGPVPADAGLPRTGPVMRAGEEVARFLPRCHVERRNSDYRQSQKLQFYTGFRFPFLTGEPV